MKIKSFICYGMYKVFGRYLPSIKNSPKGLSQIIRRLLVKGFANHCGKKVNIQPKAILSRRISIGDYSGVGKNSLIQGGTIIGEHVMMGPEVYIYTQNHRFDRTDITMDEQGFSDEKQVIIENDVWIGSRVTILPGVTIGQGSIVGASAVVTKNVPPYSVVAGNPARIVKTREILNQ